MTATLIVLAKLFATALMPATCSNNFSAAKFFFCNNFVFLAATFVAAKNDISCSGRALQEMSFFAATNVAAKNAKLLQKVFFAAKKLLLHVAGISVVAKSFARTINVAAITSVLQQQLMSLT
ncbi:hypothetical protein QL285_085514 [Trifolium repens]|nr:hypothetical protein QL285_085514 [Trifolium repens]